MSRTTMAIDSTRIALDSTEGSLKQRGVRLTRQRQILLDLIDKTGEHLDAERLSSWPRKKTRSSTASPSIAR